MERITVLLADDNLIVREGVRALLAHDPGVVVVGVAADGDELVGAATELHPQVIVTDIRMPPAFEDQGIESAKEVRRRHPDTGVVILSQFDEPEFAVSLLADGAAGFAYLLKDRVADSSRLRRAIREVATGGTMLDPEIVAALLSPVRLEGELSADQEALLADIANGRPIKAIAAARRSTPEAVDKAISDLFLTLAQGANAGRAGALRRLRMLHTAILRREELGKILSGLLPTGVVEKLRGDAGATGQTENLLVTVLMSDIRGYSLIAQLTDPVVLASQLNAHRREMNAAILDEGGTVMQYVGDAVMAVFGAPFPQSDHAVRACRAATLMHDRQRTLNRTWQARGLEPFGLGIGVSTGEVAAGFLGDDVHREYTLVGDTVNLTQRLCDLARPAETTMVSAATVDRLCRQRHGHDLLSSPGAGLPCALAGMELDELPPLSVKNRVGEVRAFRLIRPRAGPPDAGPPDSGPPDTGPTGTRPPGPRAPGAGSANGRSASDGRATVTLPIGVP